MAKRKPLAAAFKGHTERREDTEVERQNSTSFSQDTVNTGTQEDVSTGSHESLNTGTQEDMTLKHLSTLLGVGEVETVPGPKGQQVPAEQPVNMTFTVTAKERYLWNMELSRRGMTGVSVLRKALNAMLETRQP